MRIFVKSFLSLAAFLVLFVAGCSSSDGASIASQLQVEDVQYALIPGGARIITGSVHNPTEGAVSAAQLQVSLYDENNVRISSMNITVKNIPSGESIRFREPVDTDLDVRGVKVRSVLVL